MAKEIIPWQVFLEALHKQPKARLDEWLAGWRFTEEGVFAQSPAQPEDAFRRRVYNTVFELRPNNLKRRQTPH